MYEIADYGKGKRDKGIDEEADKVAQSGDCLTTTVPPADASGSQCRTTDMRK